MIWLEIPLPRSFLVRVSYTSIDLSYYFLTRHDSTGNKDKSGKAMKKLIKIFLWFDQKSLFHEVSSWGCLLFSYTTWLYRVCLDWTYCCWKLKTENWYAIHTLCIHCSRIKKILKMGPTILFTHLKIILLLYFQFSATISSI